MPVQMRWRRSKTFDALARTFLSMPALARDYQGERHSATFKGILLKQINLARRPGRLCHRCLGRMLVITINHLIDRPNLHEMPLFQEDCPIAHGSYQRVRVTCEHKDTGALNQRLHAALGASREP